ncbi:hypothetical protein ACLNGM_09230 [Aureimonas phyllosphaerae]|uniref:hypothetical protein n=1 Tax=Aureimonas phyllosphaerae TaxID=1166078 RepID=UPI003A5C51FD
MTRPTPSLRSLAELHPVGDGVLEDADRWRYAGISKPGEAEALRAAHDFAFANGWSIEVRDGEFERIPEGTLLDGDVPRDLNIILTKPVGGSAAWFLAPSAALRAWDDARVGQSDTIHVLGDFGAFRAGAKAVVPWDGTAVAPPVRGTATEEPDAVSDVRRGIVRDLSGGRMPGDLFRWTPPEPLPADGFAAAFMRAAAGRLMLALASEVETAEDGSLRVVLNGLRKRSFGAAPPGECPPSRFEALREAAQWLLVPSRDAEARHQMLVRRLEPLVPDGREDDWWGAISPHVGEALSGARTEYRTFVTSKSADLLKTMTEVRKGVAEDVDRIVGRTNRMSQAFVGGLGVLAAGLGVRIATSAASQAGTLSTLVFCAVVLFVTWSGLRLNELVSTRSLVSDLRHLRRWHSRLHQSLTRAEYRALAVSPVIEAVKLYNETRRRTRQAFHVAAWVFVLLVLVAPLLGTR